MGLFAGIGGIELGLSRAGHRIGLLCELDPVARAVLATRFPDTRLHPDVRDLEELPSRTDLIAAGFPCQDLSQAGRTAGIDGKSSGLWKEVFRVLTRQSNEGNPVPFVLIENVPFMLKVDRGRALKLIVGRLERLGYRWAYRTVDSMSFGLPQRRERVYLLAALDADPRAVLLSDDFGPPDPCEPSRDSAFGFYWTEGNRGLGAAVDAIPTLKAGSTIGIPSPPAVALPGGRIVLPGIEDAERLQGFPRGWTKPPSTIGAKRSHRWRLVGNSVSVGVAKWIGTRLFGPRPYDGSDDPILSPNDPWPAAAWGGHDAAGRRHRAAVTAWPVRRAQKRLDQLLKQPSDLSRRATEGFWSRLRSSNLRRPSWFDEAIVAHLKKMSSGGYPPRAGRKGGRGKAASAGVPN